MDARNESELPNELAKMRGEIEKLETEKLLQGDEIRALKAEARSYQNELISLHGRVQSLEEQALQDTPATNIGKEVRLRYLERHRQRMGKNIETMKNWKDVPEMVEVTSFRASLQSEGRLTRDFQVLFERLLGVAKTFSSSTDLKAAFGDNKNLQQLQDELQDCYDKIVAANLRGRQDPSPQHNP
ncbi:hypothetical protein JMJ35_008720 [Cladonia borealis]|uniref:Uncharacterized protein n=1 Tax=Cladonia borealis TaxID=184061 RepID=A0AA39QV38_9LECA|nr:hypothetical protein JMJ35_008720 [Cladonia borealis]